MATVAGWRLGDIAFVAILACAAARCFVAEMPFRVSPLGAAVSAGAGSQGPIPVDRTELSRAAFAVALLAAAGLWALGGALRGGVTIRRPVLGLLMVALAAVSILSARHAADKRSALLVTAEQASLLAAGFVMAQLCRDRKRFALVVIVLAGLGMALAVKGLEQRLWTGGEARLAALRVYGDPRLLASAAQPGSPEARIFEARVRDPAPFGFFFLANLFASLLIVLALAAAGLAAEKIRAAARSLRAGRAGRAKGEVDLPTLAAAVTAVGAALVAVVLLLTGSRGAIAAGLISALGAAAATLIGRRLRARRGTLLAVAGAAVLLGGGGLVGYGLAAGRLPTKTMTFRWLYWTGSAKIVAERPGLGVGGGNFPDAYLRHRGPGAEEAVKTPHNFIMHALTQFGVAGGAIYIGIVVAVLVGMTRPPDRPGATGSTSGPPAPSAPVVVAAVSATAMAARLLFFDWLGDPALLLLEVAMPAIVLLVCLVAASWAGGPPPAGPGQDGRLSTIALGWGAAGLAVHNLVTYSLWAPAAGLVFWVAGGACLARAGGGGQRRLSRSRWLVATLCAGAALAAAGLVLRPALLKALRAADAAGYLAEDRAAAAVRSAELAAEADPLDAMAAADAAKLILSLAGPAEPDRAARALRRAREWAEQAVKRDPAGAAYHGLAAAIAWRQAAPRDGLYAWPRAAGDVDRRRRRLRAALARSPNDPVVLSHLAWLASLAGDVRESLRLCVLARGQDPNSALLNAYVGDLAARLNLTARAREAWKHAAELAPRGPAAARALEHMARSVELDPMASRRRVAYARMLCATNRPREAMRQLDAAEKIDAALLPGSVYAFGTRELDDIRLLKARLRVLME